MIQKKIIGTSTVLLEPKFLRGGSIASNLENVAVHKDAFGQGVGVKLIQKCIDYSINKNCYKTILTCSRDLVGFYQRIGFYVSGVEMRIDHPPLEKSSFDMMTDDVFFSKPNIESVNQNIHPTQTNEYNFQNVTGGIHITNTMNNVSEIIWYVENLRNEINKNPNLSQERKIQLDSKLGNFLTHLEGIKEIGKDLLPHIVTTGLKEFLKPFPM